MKNSMVVGMDTYHGKNKLHTAFVASMNCVDDSNELSFTKWYSQVYENDFDGKSGSDPMKSWF